MEQVTAAAIIFLPIMRKFKRRATLSKAHFAVPYSPYLYDVSGGEYSDFENTIKTKLAMY